MASESGQTPVKSDTLSHCSEKPAGAPVAPAHKRILIQVEDTVPQERLGVDIWTFVGAAGFGPAQAAVASTIAAREMRVTRILMFIFDSSIWPITLERVGQLRCV